MNAIGRRSEGGRLECDTSSLSLASLPRLTIMVTLTKMHKYYQVLTDRQPDGC